MYGPVILGKLVRMRPPRADDAQLMITWFEDIEVTRFMALHHPPSLEMEREWMERMARSADDIVWAIEHEERPVGATAIHMISWKYGFGTTGTTIGDRSLWGRGIGGEVMKLRAEYAFTQLPLRKLKSGYFEGNEASARAQAAAGYREVGRWHGETFIDGAWRDHVLTELLREDWERSHSV